MIVALAGGVGAARMLVGLVQVVPPAEITAIVNTGDDVVLHGLHVSPDIDTVTYTLADVINPDTGWGLAGETWAVMDALERYGGPTWFRLGDRDLATHLYRTRRLSEGAPLSVVTAEIARAWAVDVGLLPMSDHRVETRVTVLDGDRPVEIGFQEYFVQRRHGVPVTAVRFAGAEAAAPAPGALEAIAEASTIVFCPSNPVLSIGPILAVPGIRDAVEARRNRTIAVSPIVAGAALKGPADRVLIELGHEASVVGVARLYASLISTLVIDPADRALVPDVERQGVRCVVAPAIMRTRADAARLAASVLDATGPHAA